MNNDLLMPILFSAAILLVAFAFMGDDNKQADARMKGISRDAKGPISRKNDPDAERRRKILGNLKDLEAQEKQMRKARISLSAQIEQAGLSINTTTFWIYSACAGIIAGILVMLLKGNIFVACGAVLAAGLGLPRWVLNFLVKGRQKKFLAEFPNSVEVIVRGVKSGLPLMECLKMIGREASEPLAGEFRRVVDQTAMGVPLDQAMSKMYERNPLPEVSFFTIVLAIQAKAGGNLSEALGNLANVLRSRKLMREKIKAMSSEATASASIIGSLPIAVAILTFLTTPDYIMLLFNDKTGHLALLAAATMMGTGVFVMKQMINFEI